MVKFFSDDLLGQSLGIPTPSSESAFPTPSGTPGLGGPPTPSRAPTAPVKFFSDELLGTAPEVPQPEEQGWLEQSALGEIYEDYLKPVIDPIAEYATPATALRIGLPIVGGIAGSLLGPAGAVGGVKAGLMAAGGAALGGALGEAGAETLEGQPLDPGEIALAGGLSALPAGPAARAIRPGMGLAARAGLHTLEGIGQGALDVTGTSLYRTGELPSAGELAAGGAFGGVLGGGLGLGLEGLRKAPPLEPRMGGEYKGPPVVPIVRGQEGYYEDPGAQAPVNLEDPFSGGVLPTESPIGGIREYIPPRPPPAPPSGVMPGFPEPVPFNPEDPYGVGRQETAFDLAPELPLAPPPQPQYPMLGRERLPGVWPEAPPVEFMEGEVAPVRSEAEVRADLLRQRGVPDVWEPGTVAEAPPPAPPPDVVQPAVQATPVEAPVVQPAPQPAASPASRPTFKEFVEAQGGQWPMKTTSKEYKRLKAEYDEWSKFGEEPPSPVEDKEGRWFTEDFGEAENYSAMRQAGVDHPDDLSLKELKVPRHVKYIDVAEEIVEELMDADPSGDNGAVLVQAMADQARLLNKANPPPPPAQGTVRLYRGVTPAEATKSTSTPPPVEAPPVVKAPPAPPEALPPAPIPAEDPYGLLTPDQPPVPVKPSPRMKKAAEELEGDLQAGDRVVFGKKSGIVKGIVNDKKVGLRADVLFDEPDSKGIKYVRSLPPADLKLVVEGEMRAPVAKETSKPAEPAAREPWEMTKQEWADNTTLSPPSNHVVADARFRFGGVERPGLIAHEWAHTAKEFLALDSSRVLAAFEKDNRGGFWGKETADEALVTVYGWLHGDGIATARQSPELLIIAKEIPTPPKTFSELHSKLVGDAIREGKPVPAEVRAEYEGKPVEPAPEPEAPVEPAFTRTTPKKGTPERDASEQRSTAIEAKSDAAVARVSIAQNDYDRSKYGTPRRAKAEKARDKAWAERDALAEEEKASRTETRKAYLEDLAEGPDEANRIAARAELENEVLKSGRIARSKPGSDSYEQLKKLAEAEARRQGIPEERIGAVVVDAASGISSTPGYHPTMQKAIEVANRTFDREAAKHTEEVGKTKRLEQAKEIRALGLDRETSNRLIDDFTVSSSIKTARSFEEVLAEGKQLKAAKDAEEAGKKHLTEAQYQAVPVIEAPAPTKTNERPHKTSGLTPSQAKFIAAETEKLNLQPSPEVVSGFQAAPVEGLPIRLKIGDLEFLIRTPEGASAMHRAATGKPLPGIEGRVPESFIPEGPEKTRIPKGRPLDLGELQTETAAENAAIIAYRGNKPIEAALEEVLKDSLDRGVKGIDETTLHDKAAEALKRIYRGGSPSAFGVGYFQDYAIVGADLIHRGAKNLGEFTGQLVKTFGEGIRSAARRVYEAAQRIVASIRGVAGAETERVPGNVEATPVGTEVPARTIRPIPPGAKPGQPSSPVEPSPGFNPRGGGAAEVPKATPTERALMETAAETAGTAPIEGKPSPKKGEPEFDVNVRKSSVDPDTQQFIARIVEAAPDRFGKVEGGARGAARPWEEVRMWAVKHGWNEAQLKKSFTQKGGFLSDIEMERANQLREAASSRATDHWEEAQRLSKNNHPEQAELVMDRYKAEIAHVSSLQYALIHAKSEAAHALAYAARLAEGLTPEERFIAQRFKGFKGEEKLYKEFYEAVKRKDYRRVNEITQELHKPTRMEKIVEAWKLGALSGPPTHIVNFFSTGSKVALDAFEAEFAGALDAVMHPKDRSRYMGEGKAMLRGAWAAKNKAWTELKTELGRITQYKTYEDWVAAEEAAGRRGGDTGKFGRQGKLEGDFGRAYRTVYHLMGAADQYWKNIAGSQAVHRLAYRDGVKTGLKAEGLENHIQDFIRKYADGELPNQAEVAKMVLRAAQEGTFNVPLKESQGVIPIIGRAMAQLTEKIPALGIIAPFIQTPVNIAGETIARTPLGLYKWARTHKGMEGGESAEVLARAVMGSTMMLALYGMLKTEAIEVSGGGPTDPDKKQNKIDTGWQPYSVKFGDSWVSYQRLEPLSSLIGFVADAVEAKEADSIGSFMEKAFASAGQNLTNKTFLAGLIEFMEMAGNPNRNFKAWARQMEGSFVPAIVGRTASAIDSTVRVTSPYERKYGIPEPILAKIPGASKLLEARKTPTGEERQRAGGPAGRFLNPFPVSEIKKTDQAEVQREFSRIGYVPEQPKRVRILSGGKKIELDDREYELLQSAYNEAAKNAARLIRSSSYKSMDAEEQEEALKRVYNEARKRSRARLYQDHKYRQRAARVQTGREA